MSGTARAWAALLIPPVVWYVQEQGLAGPLRIDCHVAQGVVALVWGGASLLICVANAVVTIPLARAGGDGPSVAAWLARLAILVSMVFGVAILFGTLATALVPACAR